MTGRKKIGQRVRIKKGAGMSEFHGKRGMIIDNTETDGRTRMYRVRLDAPVEVPLIGFVTDDLWAGRHLDNLDRK